jgi:DNA mismatch endonuclease (patch repair protein)
MSDVHTPDQRRRNMSAIRSADTKPEMVVRRLVHSSGFRYRLHRADLPGKPDLVFPAKMKVILVHGCFWHMHHCRYGKVRPATNAVFWKNKRESNRARDRRTSQRLRHLGWEVMTVWECQTRTPGSLAKRLQHFLSDEKPRRYKDKQGTQSGGRMNRRRRGTHCRTPAPALLRGGVFGQQQEVDVFYRRPTFHRLDPELD